MTDSAPFTPEQAARFAAGDALAEVAWLRAVADAAEERHRRIDTPRPSPASLARDRTLHEIECAAFLGYLRAPAPDVHSLAGKLLAVERWASEIAQDTGDAVLLVEALALVRADVIRLA